MQEVQVGSLQQEDPLEEETATQSSVLAWESPRTEEPGGLQSMGSQRAAVTEHAHSCLLVFPPHCLHQPSCGKTQTFQVCVPAPTQDPGQTLRPLASLCNCQSPLVHR